MDKTPTPREPDDADAEQALAGTGPLKDGLECPTCGDRFPSQAALEEHLPDHKIA